jgi:predicted PurR-regulated permease PerM
MVLVFVVVVVPSLWLTSSLIAQTTNTIEAVRASGFSINNLEVRDLIGSASTWIGLDPAMKISDAFAEVFSDFKRALTSALPDILSVAGDVLLGLVLVCFVLYYGLKEGDKWVLEVMNAVPIKRVYKAKLRREVEQATRALFFGQVLTAILIGLLCGGLFALFKISNPVFWGFIMMVLSFLPVVGAPMVYVPAGIIMMFNGHWVMGISIIVLCSLVVFIVDNIARPKFVSNSARIHPLTVIIGALGGIAFMGFVGFVVGPLILNIFMTMVTFDYDVD